MTRLAAIARCDVCSGALVPPNLLLPDGVQPHLRLGQPPDYLCMDCQRPFWWEGKPPILVSLGEVEPI
jgi:hypothetical protein